MSPKCRQRSPCRLPLAPAAAIATLVLAAAALPAPAAGGVTVYEEGDAYVEVGGQIQVQLLRESPEGGTTTDELFFRRLRPYLEASLFPDWYGKIELDLGKSSGGNEVAVKDAYIAFTGWQGTELLVGNAKPAFSREFLTSSKRQQLVERTFVGDHNYGAPDRALGAHLRGERGEHLTWGASLASATLDPDARKLDFDSPATADADFNQGWLAAARLDVYPRGAFSMAQGDLGRSDRLRFGVGVAAFAWSNDDDNDTYTGPGGTALSASKADIDSASGFEVSGALRGHGVSVDAQYNQIDADTVAPGFTGGLFRGGTTTLEVWAIEGGYMLVPSRLEVVAGYDGLDADHYADAWTRLAFGVNYFFDQHDLKTQLTYRLNDAVDGIPGADADELFVQLQYAF